MRNPDSLRVSALALELVDGVYDLTSTFPPDERFGLTAQMRRACVSVGSNIYEGCGRDTDKAFAACLAVALSETMELRFQLTFAARRSWGT